MIDETAGIGIGIGLFATDAEECFGEDRSLIEVALGGEAMGPDSDGPEGFGGLSNQILEGSPSFLGITQAGFLRIPAAHLVGLFQLLAGPFQEMRHGAGEAVGVGDGFQQLDHAGGLTFIQSQTGESLAGAGFVGVEVEAGLPGGPCLFQVTGQFSGVTQQGVSFGGGPAGDGLLQTLDGWFGLTISEQRLTQPLKELLGEDLQSLSLGVVAEQGGEGLGGSAVVPVIGLQNAHQQTAAFGVVGEFREASGVLDGGVEITGLHGAGGKFVENLWILGSLAIELDQQREGVGPPFFPEQRLGPSPLSRGCVGANPFVDDEGVAKPLEADQSLGLEIQSPATCGIGFQKGLGLLQGKGIIALSESAFDAFQRSFGKPEITPE